jgi:pyruvate dehydrogenase E1 component
MHRLRGGSSIRLLGSGTILREVEAAADILASEYDVEADVWAVSSFTELRREAMAIERWNRLHPGSEARTSYVEECLPGDAPIVTATDYIRQYGDLIRPYVRAPYTVLGTDGYGRSDFRKTLRRFFEVDRAHVVVAALRALGRDDDAAAAIAKYEIDPEAEAPWRR